MSKDEGKNTAQPQSEHLNLKVKSQVKIDDI
jgi:hypothetical protein